MITHSILRPITVDIAKRASDFYKQFLKSPLPDNKNELVMPLLEKISKFEKIPPDDWAYVQASLEESHPCSIFFAKYRNQISRQYEVEGQKLTAVPIITFTHKGERYALLMENKGLEKSVEVNEIQWTAHGVRVDVLEKNFLKSEPKLWQLLEKISNGNIQVAYLMAAAIRRVRGLGIELTEKDIQNMRPINRVAAGFPETSPFYRTEYFDVDLGERNPEELNKFIEESSKTTRFAKWTQCFKLSNLKAEVNELKFEFKDSVEEKLDPKILSRKKYRYSLTHAGKILPIRDTTWIFLKALEYVKLTELRPDKEAKDPWAMRNLSGIERALLWVSKRMDGDVQFSLFSPENNRLSSAQAHAYAAKAGMNEENFAYTAMKPRRLVLNVIIAYLTAHVKIRDSVLLQSFCKQIQAEFFAQNKNFAEAWEEKFEKAKVNLNNLVKGHFYDSEEGLNMLPPEQRQDIACIKELFEKIKTKELDDLHKTIYHLYESDLELAVIIYLHEKFHKQVMSAICPIVNALIDKEISSKNFIALDRQPLAECKSFGITGPVASGKSASEKIIRSILKEQNAAYRGSDEWNVILSDYMNLEKSGFIMHRGNLTLPEAWFIKVHIFQLLSEMRNKFGEMPNVIVETCNPYAVKDSNFIFINSADPTDAIKRVKERGNKSGRYVAGSVASSSYRWPWVNLLRTLDDAPKGIIRVIDTDILYAKSNLEIKEEDRLKQANIVTVSDNVFEIHNFKHFLHLIAHSFRVNPNPKQPKDVWSMRGKEPTLLSILKELNKLSNSKANLKIKLDGEVISKEKLFEKVGLYYATQIRPTESCLSLFLQKKRRENVAETELKEVSFLRHTQIVNRP